MLKGYVISGGDEESLRQAEVVCASLTQALKDTPLDTPKARRYRPGRIKTAMAFTDREQALAFERYLKSPSGRAFAKKRL